MKYRNTNLADTVDLMCSEHYENRFLAEYYQTQERYERLHRMIIKYEAGTLDFTPTCSVDLLKEQAHHMGMYLHVLEIRAEKEGIRFYEEE